jgi:eukaryotic-like serine/threonine-protein kinase
VLSTDSSDSAEDNEGADANHQFRRPPVRDPRRYRVIGEQGRGGLGRVLHARDREMGRSVALKELLRPSMRSEARFIREARITARLEHPSIVPVHEAGTWPSGELFYTMKLVAGRSLRELLAEKKGLAQRLELLPNVLAVADAIAYAHKERVIHRDLKPANIIVGEFGETIVIDWGLAKDLSLAADPIEPDAGPYRAGANDGVTILGEVVGTPYYMSPEQARGEKLSAATDVYSLGAILYELISGKRPYAEVNGRDPRRAVEVVRSRAPLSLAESGTYPSELVAIAERAMARDWRSRYSSAAEFAAELRRFLSGKLVDAHHYTFGALLKRWITRHRRLLVVATAAAFIVAAVGTVSIVRIVRAEHTAEALYRETLAVKEGLLQERNQLLLANATDLLRTDPTASARLAQTYDGSDRILATQILADATSMGLSREGPALSGIITSIEFLPANKVAIQSRETSTTIFDLSKNVSERTGHLEGWKDTIRSSSRRYLASQHTRNGTDVLDLQTNKIVRIETEGHLFDAEFLSEDQLIGNHGGGGVGVWSTETGALIRRHEDPRGVVRIDISADKRLVAVCYDDRQLAVYDVETWKEVVLGQCDRSSLIGGLAAFSPNSRWYVTIASADRVVAWDLLARDVHKVMESDAAIAEISMAPNGERVAIGTTGGDVVVLSVGAWQPIARVRHPALIMRARWSNGSTILATGDSTGRIQTWEENGTQRRLIGHSQSIRALAFSDDDATLVSGDASGATRVWDLVPPSTTMLATVAAPVVMMTTDSAERRAVLVDANYGVHVFDLRDGHLKHSYRATAGVGAIPIFLPTNDLVLVTSNQTVETWNPESGRVATLSPRIGNVDTLALWGAGFVVVTDRGEVYSWGSATAEPRQLADFHKNVRDAAAPNGARLLYVLSEDRTVIILNGRGETTTRDVPGAESLLPTADGGALAFAENEIFLLSEASTKLIHRARGRILSPAVARTGPWLAFGEEKVVVALNYVTGETVTMPIPLGAPRRVALSDDGRFVAVASADGSVRLFDTRNQGTAIHRDHVGAVYHLAFFSGSPALLSSGHEEAVRYWDGLDASFVSAGGQKQ